MTHLKMRFVSSCCFLSLVVLLLSWTPRENGFLPGTDITHKKKADSLQMVKDYLLQIKSAVPKDSSQVKQSVAKLRQLVRQGGFQQQVMERQIRSIQGQDAETLKDMVQQFRFIVQSAALLRSDLEQAAFSNKSVQEEIRYLHKHIPPLVHQLNVFAGKGQGLTSEQD